MSKYSSLYRTREMYKKIHKKVYGIKESSEYPNKYECITTEWKMTCYIIYQIAQDARCVETPALKQMLWCTDFLFISSA